MNYWLSPQGQVLERHGIGVHAEIAKTIMLAILYDNGYIDKCHTEKSQLSEKWQKRIAPIAGNFFDKNPEFLTDEHIENICCGIEQESNELYTSLEGYKELNHILNEYFDDGCGVLDLDD